MNILVTGATGKVGSRFVPRLLERGERVRVLVRRPEAADFLKDKGAEVMAGDLLEPETLVSAVEGVDAVVHLAAFFRGATEAQAQATNHQGTVALGQAIARAGIPKVVFISTNLVYGPGRGRPLREEDEPRPLQPYPISKLAAEQALQELQQSEGFDLRIMRLPFVYGEGDPHLAEVLPMLRSWHPARRLQMGHHRDVAQALMLALDARGSGSQIYNVADDEPIPVAEILRLNGEAVTGRQEELDREINDPWEGIVDTTRIKQELGFRPVYPSLKTAIAAQDL